MKRAPLPCLCALALWSVGGCDTPGGRQSAQADGATFAPSSRFGAIHAYVHLDGLHPVTDVPIVVSAPDGAALVRTADKCGFAVFDQLVAGEYKVRAVHDGHDGPSAKVQVDDGYDTPVELTAPPDIAPPLSRGKPLCAPRFLSGPEPDYPATAGPHGICFVAKCIIEKNGEVSRCASLDPPSDIDDATIAALEKRKYRPYLCKGGRPQPVDYTFRVVFRPPLRTKPAAQDAGTPIAR